MDSLGREPQEIGDQNSREPRRGDRLRQQRELRPSTQSFRRRLRNRSGARFGDRYSFPAQGTILSRPRREIRLEQCATGQR
jgi:hypothetical protein